jgi:hypothetical protein
MTAAEKWMILKIRPFRRRNKIDNILRSVRYGTVEKRERNGGNNRAVRLFLVVFLVARWRGKL